MIAKMPVLMAQMMQVMQAKMGALMPQILQISRDPAVQLSAYEASKQCPVDIFHLRFSHD